MTIRFAVIDINHGHIYGQIDALLGAGAVCVGFHAAEDDLAAAFAAAYPSVPRVASREALLADASVQMIVTSGINSGRAVLGLAAMRAGKDFMTDKPGVTSLAQLDELRRGQAETGR